jgi:hypothetical protein
MAVWTLPSPEVACMPVAAHRTAGCKAVSINNLYMYRRFDKLTLAWHPCLRLKRNWL